MATYIAFLDKSNVVTQVVQAPNRQKDWAVYWGQLHNCTCLETKKDGSIRHQYAVPGHTYYNDIDAFVEPSPYPSWVLNKQTIAWEAPVPMPADSDFVYVWEEDSGSWKNLGPRELLGVGADCIDC